ncbi:type II toxin-antitoxin system RelB/DinJ family antitoxin [Secundilactobacillus hailunensis]|uniref:Type II toxin-antitoxin system RelB/DinJ family antitoxin n=1 Tax=Secundilactobacillus hailunensis TaxID=2559923 RepID=A0ABW1TAJ5_9LACO|nr:type II toxin-antitoxin system RelB/DinJ family antitoxin [Secundilactobacillus hailunensis]
MQNVKKNKTVSTRVTQNINDRAKANLAKMGLTVSEYIRLSLVKAANNEVKLVSFLDTPEAHQAKYEDQHQMAETIGNIDDFEKWTENLDED